MVTGYEHDQHEFMKSIAHSLNRIAAALELLANTKSEEFARRDEQ